MADFGQPVAGHNTPPQPMQQLSDLINLKRSQQALDTGVYQQQSAQATAQADQQTMKERQLLQSSMQSGKDPDGNPLKDDKGEVSTPALAAFANKYLPLTGQQVTQSIIQTQDHRLKLNDSVRQLGQNYGSDIAGILKSFQNTNATPEEIGQQLDAYAAKNPNAGKPLTDSITNAKALLANIKPDTPMPARNNGLNHTAQVFQPANVTTAQQAPQYESYTTPDGKLGTRQVNPQSNVATGQVGTPVEQGVAQGLNASTGQPNYPPASKKQPSAPVSDPRITPMPQFPTPQEAEQADLANKKWTSIRNADSNTNSGYAPTQQVYKNLMDLIKKNPSIGPGSSAWNSALSVIPPAAGLSPNAGFQEVSGYLDRLAGQNAQQAGAANQFQEKQISNSTGSTEYNPEALSEKLRFGASALEAAHGYRQAVDAFQGNNGRNAIYNQPKLDAAWTENADPIAFRLLSASKMGDKEDFNKTMENANALTLHHYRNLKLLLKGQLPNE